ncbi:hypothetical protein ACH3VR_12955 [Microbacterium sp. B2969]|uniref:RES domain-containing protein n=1 Tax=Microbacterium alkaliflavum TaxID=3248839 RepID=A0ABW7Q8W3_9MICO
MTVLQKAVLPGREQLWTQGDDLISGFVVRATDVAWAKTPRDLLEAHGLGFAGSPFSAQSAAIDVLRFAASSLLRMVNATGIPSDQSGEPIGEGFVDHPPFTGNGFARVSGPHIVPVWWLEPTRVPPAAELWRIHADGREEFLTAYANVASGWQPGSGTVLPSDVCGRFARWRGEQFLADVLTDGRVVLASYRERDGWRLTQRGLWAIVLERSEIEEVYALRLTATWRGLPFQIVRRWDAAEGPQARIVYLGRDSRVAEAARLDKTDAAVYEATAPLAELENLQGVELTDTASGS